MIIYLVRHGETAYNRDGLGLGRSDVPLTERGQAQAKAIMQRFAGVELARVFSSPLGRAFVIAEAIAGGAGVPVEADHRLIELDVGETEGMNFPDMRNRYPEFFRDWATGSNAVRMPGGESIDDVAHRLASFAGELRVLDLPAVAVISHNFITKLLVCQLLGLERSTFRSIGADLASITTIGIDRGRVSMHQLNDVCHLRHLETTQVTS